MPARVQRAADDASKEDRSLRLFVLCDSEARWPGDHDQKNWRTLEKLAEVCTAHGAPFHVLRKRSAENYIPDEVFKAVRDDPRNQSKVEQFNSLLRRSPIQRDHFPVKGGLKPSERKGALAQGLYNASEGADLDLLENPLLPGRKRPLRLLKEERRSSFTADGLRRRDGTDEIDELLQAIAKEL